MSSIIKISKLCNHLFDMGFIKESQILVKLSSEKAEEFLKNKYPIGYSIYKRTDGVPPQAFIGIFNSFTESEMAKVNESMSFQQLKAIKKDSKSKSKASKVKKIKNIILKSDARYEDIDSITDKFMNKGFSIEDVEYLVKDTTNHSLEEKADMLHYFIQKNSDKAYSDFETLDEAVAYVSPKLDVNAEQFYKSIEDKAFQNSDIIYNSNKFTVVHSKSTEACQYWEQSAVTWDKEGRATSGLCTASPTLSAFEQYSDENYVIQIISKSFPTKNINPMVSFSENLKKNNLISMCIKKDSGEIVEGLGATVNRFNENLTSASLYILLGDEHEDILKSIYSSLKFNNDDENIGLKRVKDYLRTNITKASILSSACLPAMTGLENVSKRAIFRAFPDLSTGYNYDENNSDVLSKDTENFSSFIFNVATADSENPENSELLETLLDTNLQIFVEGITFGNPSSITEGIIKGYEAISKNIDLSHEVCCNKVDAYDNIKNIRKLLGNDLNMVQIVYNIITILVAKKVADNYKSTGLLSPRDLLKVIKVIGYGYDRSEAFNNYLTLGESKFFNSEHLSVSNSKLENGYVNIINEFRNSNVEDRNRFSDLALKCSRISNELKETLEKIIYKHFESIEKNNLIKSEYDPGYMTIKGAINFAFSGYRAKTILTSYNLDDLYRKFLEERVLEDDYGDFVFSGNNLSNPCMVFKELDDQGNLKFYKERVGLAGISDCEYFIKYRLHECADVDDSYYLANHETSRRLRLTDAYREDELSLYVMDLEEQCPEGYSRTETISDEEDFGAFYPSKDMDDVIEYNEDVGNYDEEELMQRRLYDEDTIWGSSEEERDLFSDIDRRARYSFLYKIVKGF